MANSRRAMVGWSVLFGYLCVLMLTIGLETAMHFLGPAIDGPFQLYNALRRIMDIQRPGVDFQFFHGVLIPYLHYPFFWIFGHSFFASEITRELVSTVLYPVTVVVFLKFFMRDWTRTIAWSAIVMAASIALRMTSVLVAVNSLLGIRSMLPILFPVVLCLPVSRRTRMVLGALTVGGALLLGTEQGLATIAALALVTAFVAIRSAARREYLIDAAVMIAGGVLTLVVVLLMLGGVAGMRGALQYNFKLVPLDQYWYFGAPPNIFLTSWGAIPSIARVIPKMPVVVLIGIAATVYLLRRTWKSANTPGERRDFAFSVGVVYGVISLASLLGIWANAYIQPLERILLLVGAVLANEWLPGRDERMGHTLVGAVGRSTMGLTVATLLIMIAIVPSVLVTTVLTVPHVITDHIFGRVGPVYAGIWMKTIPEGQAMINSRRGPDGKPPTLWSTYAGLLEARNGMMHPGPDYIIHALGPAQRTKYVEDFRQMKPQLVQTVSPLYTQYETWIESTSWDFYTELLRNYKLVGNTEWSLFWERQPQPLAAPQLIWTTDVKPGADVIDLPAVRANVSGPALLQVEVDYTIHNPLKFLPVVGAMPRYLVESRGAVQRDPVTLDPYVTQSRFPLIVKPGAKPALRFATYGLLPGASIEVKKIRLYTVPLAPENAPWFLAVAGAQSRQMTQ